MKFCAKIEAEFQETNAELYNQFIGSTNQPINQSTNAELCNQFIGFFISFLFICPFGNDENLPLTDLVHYSLDIYLCMM